MEHKISILDSLVEHKGQSKLLRAWIHELDLRYDTVRMRHRRGVRGSKLLAPTLAVPKTVDIRDFIGVEAYGELAAYSEYLNSSPVIVARHLLRQAIKDARK